MFRSLRAALCMTCCCFAWSSLSTADDDVSRIKSDEQILFFPTIARPSEDGLRWLVPIHGWIFEPEESDRLRRAIVGRLLSGMKLDPTAESTPIFRSRMRLFLVDNERRKRIQIEIAGKVHTLRPSAANGHIIDTLEIESDLATRINDNQFLSFHVTSESSETRRYGGRVYFPAPQGITVISDIDDTIKVTVVRDKQEMLRNTFLREFRDVEGMSDVYRRWSKSDVHFHCVSASPWQLYPPLVAFMRESGFPPSTITLKSIRPKDTSFFALFADPVEYKLSVIEPLLAAFPKRRFVLVGDSGEKDPEIYGQLARRHAAQILRIYIRDVTGDEPEDERYREAFEGIASERWQVFRDPGQIEDFRVDGATER